jgi:hypothetical protein
MQKQQKQQAQQINKLKKEQLVKLASMKKTGVKVQQEVIFKFMYAILFDAIQIIFKSVHMKIYMYA